MAGFVSRLVACLVAVVAVLQLVHLVLLNKLESTRLHELRRLQQQQQYHHQLQQQQQHTQQQSGGDQNLFQETAPLMSSDYSNQNPHHSADKSGGFQQQKWSNWRSERSAVSGGAALGPLSPDVPEQPVHTKTTNDMVDMSYLFRASK